METHRGRVAYISQPSNAVASIALTLSGPVATEAVLYRREEGRPNEPHILYLTEQGEPLPMPEREPSVLPPPGTLHLRVRIGKIIGSGNAGEVHEVEVLSLDGATAPESGASVDDLPPLVAKIAHRDRDAGLEHELWYYSLLGALQGSVVARCFGLFQGVLPELHAAYIPGGWQRTADEGGWWRLQQDRIVSAHPQMLSVLLLERLGEEPSGRLTDEVKQEVWAMYAHLARRGVDHVSFRPDHVRRVLPFASSLPSPDTGATYGWRLVDFHRARMSNRPLKDWPWYLQSWLGVWW